MWRVCIVPIAVIIMGAAPVSECCYPDLDEGGYLGGIKPLPSTAEAETTTMGQPAPVHERDDAKATQLGTDKSPLIIKMQGTQKTQQEAEQDPDYRYRKEVDDRTARLTIYGIIVGFLQTVALFVTFIIIAFVAIRQLRAYVYPGIPKMAKFSLTEAIVISIDFKNTGQTPARNFECWGTAFVASLPLQSGVQVGEPGEDPKLGTHSIASLFPGVHYDVDYDSIDVLTLEIVKELIKPNPKIGIYVAGGVRYRDIFYMRRKTTFCSFIYSEDVLALIKSERGYSLPPNFIVRFAASHIHNSFT